MPDHHSTILLVMGIILQKLIFSEMRQHNVDRDTWTTFCIKSWGSLIEENRCLLSKANHSMSSPLLIPDRWRQHCTTLTTGALGKKGR